MTIRNRVPYALMLFSGFAGLGYEMVWVRALSAGLGHEIVSVLAVMAAFFVGTAAGAWLLDRPVRASAHPHRWYAALEAVVALWAVVLAFLIPCIAPIGAGLMGVQPAALVQWGITFLLPLLLLLPATMAMGATLPAMACITVRLQRRRRIVGGLYAANTLGAVAGTLVVTFWIVPAVGFSRSQFLLAAVNLVTALAALDLPVVGAPHRNAFAAAGKEVVAPGRLVVTLLFTGLLGIGYEVMSVRIVSQVLENTVFSYAVLLAVYLLGTAAGAAFYQRRLAKRPFSPALAGLLIAQAIACTAGMWLLRFSDVIYAAVVPFGIRTAEIAVAATAFAGPTLVMGALFSHLAQAARGHRPGLGAALAVNTLGAALAPFLFGVVLMPSWGPVSAMLTICAGYLLLLPRIHRRLIAPAACCAAAAALILTQNGPFDFNRLKGGESLAAHRHGIMADVSVVRDARDNYHLKVNNHYQMGGTASRYSDRRQAFIPLMLQSNPRSALFLGLGTGTTFAAAAQFDGLQVDGVELIPEVIPLMSYFLPSDMIDGSLPDLHIFTADARRFVLARQRTYDVIIADLFHPSRDGAGFLYTREHFRAVRDRLSENGIFCQWLPLYQMDLDLLRLIVRTFLDVFPRGTAFLAHHSLTQPIVGLIGGRQPIRVGTDAYVRQLSAHPALAADLQSVGLSSVYSLLGCYLAGDGALRDFAGPGPINTDDDPHVLFEAPEFVYAAPPSFAAVDRVMTLVRRFSPRAEDILPWAAGETDIARLSAYWQARNADLNTGAHITMSAGLQGMLDQVAQPLLDVLRTSADFEAAYTPLLVMAARLYPQDPRRAEQLLAALEAAAPRRPEAGRLRSRLEKGG